MRSVLGPVFLFLSFFGYVLRDVKFPSLVQKCERQLSTEVMNVYLQDMVTGKRHTPNFRVSALNNEHTMKTAASRDIVKLQHS